MQAKYPVKVQAIRSKGRTDRFYVFIPLPLAAAIGLEAGEEVQWSLSDRNTLAVHRVQSIVPSATRKAKKKK
jgi:antitoxin component of MazEF toxin-antitoxin module